MKIFVDANIYLGFIRLSQEKIDYLRNFKKLVNDKKIELVFPKTTQDEVFRNIPVVSNAYLTELDNWLPSKPKFAVSVKDKKKVKEISKIYDTYKKKFIDLRSEYLKSVDELQKDILIPLIQKSIDCYEDENCVKLAELRKKKGNPPGKGSHIGDEIVWELILSKCNNDDVAIVSNDVDWKSPLQSDKQNLHPFLIREWESYSKKSINYFDSLGGFMKTQYKEEIKDSDINKEKMATLSVNSFPQYYAGSTSASSISPSNVVAYANATMNSYPTSVGSTESLNYLPTQSHSLRSARSSTAIICPNCNQIVDWNVFPYTLSILCPYCSFAIPL